MLWQDWLSKSGQTLISWTRLDHALANEGHDLCCWIIDGTYWQVDHSYTRLNPHRSHHGERKMRSDLNRWKEMKTDLNNLREKIRMDRNEKWPGRNQVPRSIVAIKTPEETSISLKTFNSNIFSKMFMKSHHKTLISNIHIKSFI